MSTQFFYERKIKPNGHYDENFGKTFALEVPAKSRLMAMIQDRLNGSLAPEIVMKVGLALCKNERFVKSVGRDVAGQRLTDTVFKLARFTVTEKTVSAAFTCDYCAVRLDIPIVGNEDSVRFIALVEKGGEYIW